MTKYCIKRIMLVLPVLLGISLLAFLLGVLAPGDPAEIALNQNGLEAPTEEQIQALREELGLNRPLYLIYLSWFARVLQGDLGASYISGRDILQDILLRLPNTIEIAVLALILAGVGGIAWGMLCALKPHGTLDNCIKNITNIILAVPSFWLALLLILIFGEILRWLPTNGSESFKHFILPSIVLSLSSMATICRYMRGALLEEMGKQYFLVARLRGINRWRLFLVYALPNALVPVIALLGNYFASVLGGSVIAETIFAIPGISSMAFEAIKARDYPVLQAYVLVTGWTLVLVTLAVDIIIAWINPKIKLGEDNGQN